MAIQEILNTEHDITGKPISLGLDEEGRLYVNGARVITEQKIRLSSWVNCAVVLASIGTVVQAIFAVLAYFR